MQINSFIPRIPPTGPIQTQRHGDSCKNERAIQLPEGVKGEPVCSHLLSPRSLTVLTWGGRETSSSLVLQLVFTCREATRQGLICSVCSSNPNSVIIQFWQAEGVLIFAGFWNTLTSSQAPDLAELKSYRGSRKCCV